MGDEPLEDAEHPELEEVNAFVDEVLVEDNVTTMSVESDKDIIALEELISMLKQDDVKASLAGMKMNVSISFTTKEDEV